MPKLDTPIAIVVRLEEAGAIVIVNAVRSGLEDQDQEPVPDQAVSVQVAVDGEYADALAVFIDATMLAYAGKVSSKVTIDTKTRDVVVAQRQQELTVEGVADVSAS